MKKQGDREISPDDLYALETANLQSDFMYNVGWLRQQV
jgi:hypothetical protein